MPRTWLLLLALGALGCGDDGPSTEVTARITDVTEADGRSTITFTLRNGTAAPIYLEGCPSYPSIEIERRENGAWAVFAQRGQICHELSWQQTVLAPGAVLSDTYRTDLPGPLRLRVLYGPSPEAAYSAGALTQGVTLSP